MDDYRLGITVGCSIFIAGMFLWGLRVLTRMKAAIAHVNRGVREFKTLLGDQDGSTPISALPDPPHSLARRYLRLLKAGQHYQQLDTDVFVRVAEEELVQHDGLFLNVSGSLTVLGLAGTFLGLIIAIWPIQHILQNALAQSGDVQERFNSILTDLQGSVGGMAIAWATSLLGVVGTFWLRIFGYRPIERDRLIALRGVEETVEEVIAAHLQPYANTLEARISQALVGVLGSFYERHANVLDTHRRQLEQTMETTSGRLSGVLDTHRRQLERMMEATSGRLSEVLDTHRQQFEQTMETTSGRLSEALDAHRRQFEQTMEMSFRGLSEQMDLLREQSQIVRQGAEALQRCADAVREGGEDFREATKSFKERVTRFVRITEPFERLHAATERMLVEVQRMTEQVVTQVQEVVNRYFEGHERDLNALRTATEQMMTRVQEMMTQHFEGHERRLNNLDIGIGQTLSALRDRTREEEYRLAIENLTRLAMAVHQTDQDVLRQQQALRDAYTRWHGDLQTAFQDIRQLGQEILACQRQIGQYLETSGNGIADVRTGLSESGPLSQRLEIIGNTLRALNPTQINDQIDQMHRHIGRYEELLRTIDQSIRAINGRSVISGPTKPLGSWLKKMASFFKR